jgi:hypothetical protein
LVNEVEGLLPWRGYWFVGGTFTPNRLDATISAHPSRDSIEWGRPIIVFQVT